MVNKKQTLVVLLILASLSLMLIYLSQTTSVASAPRKLDFSSPTNNIQSPANPILSKLVSLPSASTSTLPCSNPSGGGCQSTIAGAGTCGAKASLNGGSVCVWICTPQSCQITESIVTMYQASSLNALFSQLNNLLSDLSSSSTNLNSMSSQLSSSSTNLNSVSSQLSSSVSQISSGYSQLSSSSSIASSAFSVESAAASNMNSQSIQLGNSVSSLDSISGFSLSQLSSNVSSARPGIHFSSPVHASLQANPSQQINSLISQINSDEAQINSFSSQSVASATQISNSNNQLMSLSMQINDVASQINGYNSQIQSVASQADSVALNIGSNANQINSLASQLQSAASQLGPSGSGIVAILSGVISLTSQITTSVSQFQTTISQTNAVTSQIGAVSSQLSSYAGQINSYSVGMALANSQINLGISQLQSNSSQAIALGLQIESDASQIQVLETQMGSQGSQQVISQAAQVGSQAAKLVSSGIDLSNSTSKLNPVESQINNASSVLNSGTQQIASSYDTLNSAASQLNQLGPQLSATSGQIGSIASQIGPVISQIASLIFQSSLSKSNSNASTTHALTPFASTSGSGFTTAQVLPGTFTISPTNSVAQYNYQSAPYYITCPLSPEQNPTDQQYIYTQLSPWIVGNECAAGLLTPPLLTITTFTVNFDAALALVAPVLGQADPNLVKASATPMKVSNPGTQTENVLAYSPEVDNSISDAFSSQFYIYQHAPSFTAHSIWEWYGNIANFSNAIQPVYFSQTFPLLYWTPSISVAGIPVGTCTYSYSYKANVGLVELDNNYIPFNVIVPATYDANGFSAPTQVQFQATVLPYFSYQYALGAPYGQLFQINESIYNPSTYYTPYNSIDEFPINSTSLFFASYPSTAFGIKPCNWYNLFGIGCHNPAGSSSFLESFQRDGMGVNAMTAANVLILGQPSSISSAPISVTGSYYNPIGSGCTVGRIDQGKDYGGSCNLYAIGSGTVVGVSNSGWPGGAFIAIDLTNPLPVADCAGSYADYQSNGGSAFPVSSSSFIATSSCSRVYYAEAITPSVTVGEHVSACQIIGTATGAAYPGIELGWADPAAVGDSLFHYQTSIAYKEAGDSGATPEGTAYSNWIASLNACGPSTQTPPPPTTTVPSPNPQPSGTNVPPVSSVSQGLSNSTYKPYSNSSMVSFKPLLNSNHNSSLSPQLVQVLASTGAACPNQVYVAGDPTVLSVATADACAQQAGFSGTNLEVAVAIAQAESSLEPGNTNFNGGVCPQSAGVFAGQPNEDRGVVQINNCAHPSISDAQAFNPTTAFQEMYVISGAGSSFLPWCTYDPGCNPSATSNGAYCSFMPSGYVGPYCNGGSGATSSPGSTTTSTYTDTQTGLSPSFYTLANPISIAVTPTDYIYVLNYSPNAPESCSGINGGCIGGSGKTGAYFINIFRVFPQGRYNMSAYPPNVIGSVSCSNSAANCNIDQNWQQLWSQYWTKSTNMQQNQTIFIKSIDLTQLTGGWTNTVNPWNPFTDFSNSPVFIPINISVDSLGNVYVSGANSLGCVPGGNTCPSFLGFQTNYAATTEIVKVTNTITSNANSPMTLSSNTIPMPVAQSYIPEIAVSPDGAQIFLAGPSNGDIYVVNGNTLAYEGHLSLSFSKKSGQASEIGVNVISFFSNNGLYNVSIPQSSPSGSANTNYFDTSSFHHPLGLQDLNGYLYVLDDWQGTIGSTNFASLIYRVINTTGYDVPINPTFTNNLWQTYNCVQPDTNTCITTNPASVPGLTCGTGCTLQLENNQCSIGGTVVQGGEISGATTGKQYACVPSFSSTTTNPQNPDNPWPVPTSGVTALASQSTSQYSRNIFPPYGWVLSATVSSGSGTPVTFCSSSNCQYWPGNMPANYHGDYLPLGPELSTSGVPADGGLVYSINQNGTTTILFPDSSGSALNSYQELLFVDFNVQNYTNYQISQGAYQCYIGNSKIAQSSACAGAYANNPAFMSALNNMQEPLYSFNDPFKYLIGIGSQSIPSYDSSFYTTFSVNALGSGSGSTGVNYVACANAFSNSLSTGCSGAVNSLVASNEISNYINSNSLSGGTATAQNTQQTLSSQIYGDLLVPYMYQFSIVQQYTNFAFVSLSPLGVALNAFPPGAVLALCQAGTMGLNTAYGIQNSAQSATPPTYTVYYYNATTKTSSNRLQVPVQGGPSYLSTYGGSNNNYYQPNLSDQGTIISPQLLYLLRTNRQIGDIYVNITPWNSMLQGILPIGLPGLAPSQDVLNATVLENYKVTLNMQLGALLGSPGFVGFTPLGGYETITANAILPQQYGQNAYQNIQCGSSLISQVLSGGLPCNINGILPSGLGGSSYATANTGFNFTTAPNFNHINLFSTYENLTYADNLFLYLNGSTYTSGGITSGLTNILGSTTLLGYNRLIYVINDVFNNSIYVPLDADIANTTKINLNLNPKISPTNPNQTTIYINGTVGYYTDFGTKFVPLANAPVYLYYGADINYVNYNPNSDPANVMLCTYGYGANTLSLGINANSLPTPQQCQLANPAFSAQLSNSDQSTYHPQYGPGNACEPAANSLLTPLNLNCNIYGTDGNSKIPQTCGASYGGQEFCVPIYSNGTGVCTSQIGLIGGSVGITSLLNQFDSALGALSSSSSQLASSQSQLTSALSALSSFSSSVSSSSSQVGSSLQRLSSMLSAQASTLSQASSTSSQISLQVASLQTEAKQLTAMATAQGSLSSYTQGNYVSATPVMSPDATSFAHISSLQSSSTSAQITALASQISSSATQISASSSAAQSSLSQLSSSNVQANSVLSQAGSASSQITSETSQINSASSQMTSISNQLGPSISQMGSLISEFESISSQLSATSSPTLQIASIASEIISLVPQIASSAQQVQADTNQVTSVNSQASSSSSQLTSSASQLSLDSSQLSTSATQSTSSISQVQSSATQIGSQAANVQSAASQLESLASQMGSSGSQLSAIASQLASTSSQLQSSSSQLATTSSQLSTSESQFTPALSQLGSTSSQITSTSSQISSSISQVGSASSAISASSSQASSLASQISSIASQIASSQVSQIPLQSLGKPSSSLSSSQSSPLPSGMSLAVTNPIPSATTNANGVFTSNIVACGIGNADIIASFYGLPGNEPYQVTQPLLGYSAQPNPTTAQGTSSAYATFNVLNFYWAPASTSVTTQIGLYELNYGEISAVAIVALGILFAMALAYIKSSGKRHKKASKSRLR